MRQWISALALLLVASQALGQARNIEFVEYDLDNGLHVILHQDNSTPNVVVSMMYHVGSKNEDPNLTGFAHFFEHLLFEGSANIERGGFDRLIREAGGTFNANTSQDRTFYYDLLPSNQLELGLYLESERLMHAKIDQTGVDVQKEVVKEEKRQRIDNQPYMSFMTETLSRAFGDHPYHWAPIGEFAHIDAASMDDFKNFYNTFYVPNNATLSIAGDLDIAETKQLVEAYFAQIPRGTKEIPRPKPFVNTQNEEIRADVEDNIQLPGVFQSYHMPPQGTDDYYALQMLQKLLSDGQSSRLFKELVDNQQKALQVFAFPMAMEDGGLFITLGLANMGVEPGDLEKAMDAVIDEVKETPISEREFQKLRNQMENDFVSQNSTIAGVAENLANYHVYFGDANLINNELDRYMAVTREDIQRVAKEYLQPEKRVVLHYLPKPSGSQPNLNKIESEGDH